MQDFVKNILTDLKVDLSQEFDRNFERKAFFTDDWKQDTKFPNHKGSLMQRSGKLRRSLRAKENGNNIDFTSNMPYADIHNTGGKIVVTARMKRFFWAMYRKSSGAVVYSVKKRQALKNKRNTRLTAEAEKWKSLALKEVGSTITIDKRQFIGFDHPEVHKIIRETINHNFKDIEKQIKNQFKQK